LALIAFIAHGSQAEQWADCGLDVKAWLTNYKTWPVKCFDGYLFK
jgi:hypothetical protein